MNTSDEILNKIFKYCAYQERCRQEVERKLKALGAFASDVEEIMAYLEEEGFLNEERYARAFAGGKFRVKRWGRLKIRQELRKKRIDEDLIDHAIQWEIPETDYLQSLRYLLENREGLSLSFFLVNVSRLFFSQKFTLLLYSIFDIWIFQSLAMCLTSQLINSNECDC